MNTKKIVGVLSVVIGVVAAQAEVIIKDDFDNMTGAGDSITNSVLEVGSGAWVGSLESNGGNVMRAPSNPAIQEGASIALPAFNPGDIITIKARAARTDTTTAWFGMGFSDSSSTANLSANTPWATFYATTGGSNIFGGPSTANSTGIAYRPSGGVGTASTLMEFTYDTGAGTVTTVYGGETIHDAVAITPSGTPTLDHAFFIMRDPTGGGPPGSYLVDFEVSVIPEPATLGLVGSVRVLLLLVRRIQIR